MYNQRPLSRSSQAEILATFLSTSKFYGNWSINGNNCSLLETWKTQSIIVSFIFGFSFHNCHYSDNFATFEALWYVPDIVFLCFRLQLVWHLFIFLGGSLPETSIFIVQIILKVTYT